MGMMRYIIALCAIAQPISADVSGDYSCYGVLPDWSLNITDSTAIFAYPDPIAMDVMQDGYAEGSDKTRALTLLGGRQTAIIVISEGFCRINTETFSTSVTVLTQKSDDPIILEGCCSRKD
jgi:hypothetical protein